MVAARLLSLPVSTELLQSSHKAWYQIADQFRLHYRLPDYGKSGLDQLRTYDLMVYFSILS